MAKSRTAARSSAAPVTRTAPRVRRIGWWQRPLTWLLLVLACLAVPAAVLAGWARWDLLDADRYVRTVAPLATEPAVQDAAIAIANTAFGASVSGGAGGASSGDEDAIALAATPAPVAATPLPGATPAGERATPGTAATPVSPTSDAASGDPQSADVPPPPTLGQRSAGSVAQAAGRRAASAAIAATVRSPVFAEDWDRANRAAHDSLTDPAALGQPVVLDLAPLANRIAGALGPGAEAALPDPAAMQVVLLDAEAADRARDMLNRAGWLGIVLPVAAVLLIVGTLWVAPSRLAALRRLGFGVVLTTVVTLLALLVAATGFGGRIASPSAPIAAAIVDAVLRAPLLWLGIVALAGLLVAVLAVAIGWLFRDRPAATPTV